MKEKFSCKRCGACCKKFGPEDRNYLPLYDWEINEFKLLAKKFKINNLDIRPVNSFYDSKTKKLFTVIYGLFDTPCPFYSEKIGCKIYNKRPFVCRAFPLFWIPKTAPNKIFGINCFGYCRKFDHYLFLKTLTKKPLTSKGISRKVHLFYENCYTSCLNSNKINLFLTEMLNKFENKDVIRIKKIDLTKSNISPISFFEFLLEMNIFSKKRINKIIQKFKNLRNLD